MMKDLDEAVAIFLAAPDSKGALRIAREARALSHDGGDLEDRCADLHETALSLHRSAVILESDPEIVKKNTLARLLASIMPALNTWEEIRSMEDRGPEEVIVNILGIISEVATGTQYLESARMNTMAHFEEEMVRIEERMAEIAARSGDNVPEKIRAVEVFLDGIRARNMKPMERPLAAFSLWILLMILSYKRIKDSE
ncbi:MAG: hypothetical protein ACMUIG_07335 [Thermoplasmatota archaeon]